MDGLKRQRLSGHLRIVQSVATLPTMETLFSGTRTLRLNRVPPPLLASAFSHLTATTWKATYSTTQPAFVAGRLVALPVLVCIVPTRHLSAVPSHNAKILAAEYLTPKNARVSRRSAYPKTVPSAMPRPNHVKVKTAELML